MLNHLGIRVGLVAVMLGGCAISWGQRTLLVPTMSHVSMIKMKVNPWDDPNPPLTVGGTFAAGVNYTVHLRNLSSVTQTVTFRPTVLSLGAPTGSGVQPARYYQICDASATTRLVEDTIAAGANNTHFNLPSSLSSLKQTIAPNGLSSFLVRFIAAGPSASNDRYFNSNLGFDLIIDEDRGAISGHVTQGFNPWPAVCGSGPLPFSGSTHYPTFTGTLGSIPLNGGRPF